MLYKVTDTKPITMNISTALGNAIAISGYLESGYIAADLALSGCLVTHITDASGSAVITSSGISTYLDGLISGSLHTEIYSTSGDIINYVDNSVARSRLSYFLNKTPADIAPYYGCTDADLGGVKQLISGTINSTQVSGIIISKWITASGEPPFRELLAGIYDFHIHMYKSGTRPVSGWGSFCERTNTGTVIEIARTELFNPLTTTEVGYDLHCSVVSGWVLGDYSRLSFKVYAMTGPGASTDIITAVEGTTDSHVSLATNPNILNNIYLRQDGTKRLTGDWDAGAQDITLSGQLNLDTLSFPSASSVYTLYEAFVGEDTIHTFNIATPWHTSGNITISNSIDADTHTVDIVGYNVNFRNNTGGVFDFITDIDNGVVSITKGIFNAGVSYPFVLYGQDQRDLAIGDGIGMAYYIPSNSSYTLGASIEAIRETANDADSLTTLLFRTASVGTLTDVMSLTSGKRVGIQNRLPVTQLDVSGIITASGGNSTDWNTAYGWGDWHTPLNNASGTIMTRASGVSIYLDNIVSGTLQTTINNASGVLVTHIHDDVNTLSGCIGVSHTNINQSLAKEATPRLKRIMGGPGGGFLPTSNFSDVALNVNGSFPFSYVVEDYYDSFGFHPGIVWHTTNNSSGVPKASIVEQNIGGLGSYIYLCTTNAWAAGTNEYCRVNYDGTFLASGYYIGSTRKDTQWDTGIGWSSGSGLFVKRDGTTPLTADWNVGAYKIGVGRTPATWLDISGTYVANMGQLRLVGTDNNDYLTFYSGVVFMGWNGFVGGIYEVANYNNNVGGPIRILSRAGGAETARFDVSGSFCLGGTIPQSYGPTYMYPGTNKIVNITSTAAGAYALLQGKNEACLALYHTDATTNYKWWYLSSYNNRCIFDLLTDAGTGYTAQNVMVMSASGIFLNAGASISSSGGSSFYSNHRNNYFGLVPVTVGYDGSDYPNIGYGYSNTAVNYIWKYSQPDTSSMVQFTNGGFIFKGTATVGVVGNQITYTDFLTISNAGHFGFGRAAGTPLVSIEGDIDFGTAEYNRKGLICTRPSPYQILTISSSGATGNWFGALNFDVSYNTNTLFTALTARATSTAGLAYIGINTTVPSGSLDVRGALSFFGSLPGYTYIDNDTINFRAESNANNGGWINYEGYQQGITQFRDLTIGDGKHNAIVFVDGSVPEVDISATLSIFKSGANKELWISDSTGATLHSLKTDGGKSYLCASGALRCGSLGIGTTNPGNAVDVNGGISATSFTASGIQTISLVDGTASGVAPTCTHIELRNDWGGGDVTWTVTAGTLPVGTVIYACYVYNGGGRAVTIDSVGPDIQINGNRGMVILVKSTVGWLPQIIV